MTRIKKAELIDTKQKCSCCGDLKDLKKDYYVTSSPFHKHTSRLHVCKDCILNYIGEDVNKLKQALRMIDKAFLVELYNSSRDEAENLGHSVTGKYMKNIQMPQYKSYTWDDSDYNEKKEELNQIINNGEVPKELLSKWGSNNYSKEDIGYLENFFDEYRSSYATDTPVQVNLYRNIAKVHLQAEKELANGQTKNFKDLMELSSKLHNDGNIKPIQSTGANDDKGLSTYGLWIKTIEQEEPCEYFKNKSVYEDFNKFKKYIENWFVRPFKNIFNISKDFDVKDDD